MRHQLLAHAGITLVEVMLALMTMMIIQPVLLSALNLVSQVSYAWELRQNQLGILQLRRKIALGVNLQVSSDTLSFIYDDQKIRLVCKDQELLQQPGNMPYLIALTSCAWKKQNEYVILDLEMEGYHQTIIIGILD